MNLDTELSILMQRANAAAMTLPQIIAAEIQEFKDSEKYQIMVEAEQYYLNKSDVQNKENDVDGRSNSQIEHPILKKLIDQKVNYLLSREFSVKTDENEKAYADALNTVFDNGFRKKIKSFARGSIKSGICYLQPYFAQDNDGTPRFKVMRLPAVEVIPLWIDSEHTDIDGFIRFYEQIVYEGKEKKTYIKAEYWDREGVKYFVSTDEKGTEFIADVDKGIEASHFTVNDKPYNWDTPPLVWLPYNEDELPLVYFIKSLIDDLNWQTSVTADALRDIAKFIFVIKNYGGTDLAEFLTDLKRYLAIKVTDDGSVDKIETTINTEAVKWAVDKNRRDIYDYAAGVDTKDPELGTASGTAINFRYMDLDNDCSSLGSELKDCFLQLKPFLDSFFSATNQGDFKDKTFDIVFNADMPSNETDVINNVKNSNGIISHRSQLENHPYVTDVDKELERIAEEKRISQEEYGEEIFDHAFGVDNGEE